MDALALYLDVRRYRTQQEVADHLGRSLRQIRRWEHEQSPVPVIAVPGLKELLPMKTKAQGTDFTFIDLFAGIGGIRLGFEQAGGECVFTSEWNEYARKTYVENYGEAHPVEGDITKIDPKDIPDHDVLLAGFPCQPFSIAGVSKKNALGRPHGFECSTQGTLFFDIQEILRVKRPKAFLLENVKNLQSHDGGNTFRVIKDVLENQLGYKIAYQIVDGKKFLPQHRERILIVGFREDTDFTFDDYQFPESPKTLADILHPEDGSESVEGHFTMGPKAKIAPRYVLTEKLWDYLQGYAAKHQAAGNGFGFGLVRPKKDQYTRTLSARYYKDGSEILIDRGKGKRPRRLTPRECARLMGFPDTFKIPVSDTQAYKQFGNSVVVPVMAEVARIMKPRILELKEREESGVTQPRLKAA